MAFIRSVNVDESAWRVFEELCSKDGKSKAVNLLIQAVVRGFCEVRDGGLTLELPGIAVLTYDQDKNLVVSEESSAEVAETQHQRISDLLKQNEELRLKLSNTEAQLEEVKELASQQQQAPEETFSPQLDLSLGVEAHQVIAQQARLIEGLKSIVQELQSSRPTQPIVESQPTSESSAEQGTEEYWHPTEDTKLPVVQDEEGHPLIPGSEEFLIAQNLLQLLDLMPNGSEFAKVVDRAFEDAAKGSPLAVDLNPPLQAAKELALTVT